MRYAAFGMIVMAGCAIGAPPGFSDGNAWEFPLVGALEGGPLIVPVKVHGKGPYLFVIDPDSPISQVDQGLVEELDLLTVQGPEFVSEQDESKPTFVAEVLRIELGNLTVRSLNCLVMRNGTFHTAGREVRGALGRDVIRDSLAFGFDRDRAMGYLATQEGFRAPEGAIVVGYSTRLTNDAPSDIAPVPRRLVDVQVNERTFAVHLDLGEGASQLRRSAWAGAGLEARPVRRELVDETGSMRTVQEGAIAREVRLGDARAADVLFVPYDDRRWYERHIAGTIGLDFLDGHVTWVNWHRQRVFLTPRTAIAPAERIGRWGAAFAGCPTVGCVAVALQLPSRSGLPEATPDADGVMRVVPQPPVLSVTRGDAVLDTAIEVMIEARAANGAPLPHVVAIVPAGARMAQPALEPRYIGATLAVVDVTPFARRCEDARGCAYLLDR